MKRDNESGQSLVELALTLPLLLLFLLGAVELGQVCYGAISVSNAAKAAAQYGAQNGSTAVNTAGMLTAARADVGNVPGLTKTGLIMPRPVSMPDGSDLPLSAIVWNTSGSSTSGSYCSCSSPDADASKYPPFACGSDTALTKCTGGSALEQNIIIQTKISVSPIVALPGLPKTYDLYGHAVVKRLQ
jgi:hypothetical protein